MLPEEFPLVFLRLEGPSCAKSSPSEILIRPEEKVRLFVRFTFFISSTSFKSALPLVVALDKDFIWLLIRLCYYSISYYLIK